MKTKNALASIASIYLILTLSACGGGGGSSTTALTPTTQAPVASTGANTSTELASSASVAGYRSLSIAARTTNGVQTASILQKFKATLAGLFIKPAFAQSTNTCQTDAYKLVGVGEDGSLTPIQVTRGADSCNVGFREMFDLGSYIMLTGEGIYKNDLTCNIVFLQKSSGALFCVGENLASRYQIVTASGTSTSTTAGSSTSNAEKVQTILDANGATTYALVNAQSTTFDSNNQISGIKTKVLRFDLTDAVIGPKAAVILEGFQMAWSSYTTANEFEYYSLDNYRLAKNGDVLTASNKSVWIPGASGSSRRNLKYFYDFSDDGSTFQEATLREEEALTAINAARRAQANTTSSATVGTASSSATYTDLGNVQVACMFDAPGADGGVLITIPSNSWITGNNGGMTTQEWVKTSTMFRVTRPTSSAPTKPVITFVKPSLLCADSNNYSASMYGGNINTPQKIGDTWYTLQTQSSYSYGYDANFGWRSTYGEKTSVIGNSLGNTQNNVNDDLVFIVPTNSNTSNGTGYYWGGGMDKTKIKASKDYLFLIKQDFGAYMPGQSTGMVVSRFKPQDQQSGYPITSIRNVIEASQNLTITSFTTSQKDNVADLVARDLTSDDLNKVYGTIAEDGSYSQKPIVTTKYSTVAIVKM